MKNLCKVLTVLVACGIFMTAVMPGANNSFAAPDTSAAPSVTATAGESTASADIIAASALTTGMTETALPTATPAGSAAVTSTPNPSSDNKKQKIIKKITLNKLEFTLRSGKTKQLRVKFTPNKGLTAKQKKIIWSSSNEKVAKVNSKGLVKAKKRGDCRITATSTNGKKAVCKVTVFPKLLFSAKLASYSTTFSTDTTNNRNRKWNMQKACKAINKTVVKPGQSFSFNDAVGPRTAATGYKIAGAYRNGESTSEYGGGICQCSTTLYNAVLRADLKVIYRRNHSFTVPYVPVGLDATVSYGEVDFIWENSTKWPIKIKAHVSGNKIYVTLLGTRPKGIKKKVQISTKILKTVARPVQYVYGNQYSSSGTVIQSGHTGYTAQSFKTVTVNGKVQVRNALIATSTYNTMPMIIGKKK